ncbi:MAG: nucleoside recognition domain-containing protein [Bacillota bacterium]
MEQKERNRVKNLVEEATENVHRPAATRRTDKLDRFLAHRFYGLIVFILILWGVFTTSQNWAGPILAEYLNQFIGLVSGWVEAGLSALSVHSILQGLILEGIIGGFGAVVGFLPLIMVLFFLLYLLEDSGYMARVALLMDRYFKKIGLAGKSIIPMYVGTACSIPAIMSARTIKNTRQRRMTILLTPFIPCGAKLPVIALLLGVFFTTSSLMTAFAYLGAIFIIFVAGWIIKRLVNPFQSSEEDSFLMVELPDYQVPSLKKAFFVMLQRAKAFIIKAGTIIVLMNIVIWFLTNFDFSFSQVADIETSMLRYIATPLAWLLTPIGIASWGLAAAAVLGFVAKEEVVGALAVIFSINVGDDFGVVNPEATRALLSSAAGMTGVSAIAYLSFNLFTPPCFAAIGAMKTEFESRAWTVFAIFLQLFIGFMTALLIYQIGTLVVTGEFGMGFPAALIVVIVSVLGFLYLNRLSKRGKGLAKLG